SSAKKERNFGGLIIRFSQEHVMVMEPTLNKMKGIKNLTNKKYISWGNRYTSNFYFQKWVKPTPQVRSQPRSIAQRRKINPISDLSTMNKDLEIQTRLKTSVSSPIKAFNELKTKFINRGGYFIKNHLEVRNILRNPKPINFRTVIAPLKQYEDKNSEFQFESNKFILGLKNLQIVNNTSKPNPNRLNALQPNKEWFEIRGLKYTTHKHKSQTAREQPSESSLDISSHTSAPTILKKQEYIFVAYNGNEVKLFNPKLKEIWDTSTANKTRSTACN
ncbi:hypothetical protein VP01_3982g4, partial [Puccinia sorghi]